MEGKVRVKCVVPDVKTKSPFLFSLFFIERRAVNKSSSVCKWGNEFVRNTIASNVISILAPKSENHTDTVEYYNSYFEDFFEPS